MASLLPAFSRSLVSFAGYSFLRLLSFAGIVPFRLPWSEMFMSSIFAAFFAAMIGYHTKLIVSGKHSKYKLHQRDPIFGAMALYNDIISLFLQILRIMSESDRRKGGDR